ncbi:MAG: hypothetical protein NT103_07165 [Campylobacterales bacterium]|nr:hypothetical protein [Campylobacterales bacterium]
MAEFSSVYNALLLLLGIFEFGIPISFLRFYQMYKITFLINAVLQLTILAGLIIIAFSPLGTLLIEGFHLEQSEMNIILFFIALITQLSWSFSRNILLAERRYTFILTLSVFIFLIRTFSLGYLYYLETLRLNSILMSMFIIPFIPVFYVLLANNVNIISTSDIISNYRRTKKIFFFYLKRFIKFSLMTFIIGVLYVFSGRYLIIYLTEQHQISLLADLGYAMTFLGIMTIASASFRTFFVSKFHLGDKKSIILHLNNYMKQINLLVIFAILIAALLSITVYFIMPNYLSINAPIFVFIMTASYGIIFLMSLITFLSPTMNYNVLEITINAARLIIIVAITRFVFLKNPIFGFLLINLVLLIAELIFAKIILKRLHYVH